ncbi:MAG: sulfur carrier protein ThiS adenylyltransferase ThiF [Anaerohalosphaeraceae bacterium]|nr:sulfur carrier protein ThiS adenylyltransferase ThiF [Anaerohalosphaeraceae bacterium]
MSKLTRQQFDEMLIERHGADVHKKLNASTVGIAGLGGLGSNVAAALVRMGVGRLIITDFDIVEPSNLNRQNYRLDQLGCDKVQATIENLKSINPYVRIDGFLTKLTGDNIPEIFRPCDIVAECFDSARAKQMLIETVLTKMEDTIVVAASGLAGYGRSNAIKTEKINSRLIITGDRQSGIEKGLPLFAPRVTIAAGHQGNAIIELIIDGF